MLCSWGYSIETATTCFHVFPCRKGHRITLMIKDFMLLKHILATIVFNFRCANLLLQVDIQINTHLTSSEPHSATLPLDIHSSPPICPSLPIYLNVRQCGPHSGARSQGKQLKPGDSVTFSPTVMMSCQEQDYTWLLILSDTLMTRWDTGLIWKVLLATVISQFVKFSLMKHDRTWRIPPPLLKKTETTFRFVIADWFIVQPLL